MKSELTEFQLTGHPLRLTQTLVGWPAEISKKRIVRRRREFFITLDPNIEAERRTFRHWYSNNVLLLNGHAGAALAKFDPAFAQPECDSLLKAVHEAQPEIEKLQRERQTLAAERAIMAAALAENTNVNSTRMFREQIRGYDRRLEDLQDDLDTIRRKLAADQQRILDLLARENARLFEAELAEVRTESEAINSEIMAAYCRANDLRPRLQRLSELTPAGKDFSPELGYLTNPYLDSPNLRALMNFRTAPALQLAPNSLRFQLRNVEPVQPQGGKK